MSTSPTFGVEIRPRVERLATFIYPLQANTTIGLVGTAANASLKAYPTLKAAMADTTEYPADSGVMEALKDFEACNIDTKFIISGFQKNDDAATHKNNALAAIEKFKESGKQFGIRPGYLIGPTLAGLEYFNKFKGVSEALRAVFFAECEKKTLNEIKNEVSSMVSSRCITTFQSVKRADGAQTVRPLSSFVLGTWLTMQANPARNIAESFSNTTPVGFVAIQDLIEHDYETERESNEYRKQGLTVAIQAPGLKLWGDGVREGDAAAGGKGFEVIQNQVIMDMIHNRLSELLALLVDRPLYDVPNTIHQQARGILDNLQARGIILNYRAEMHKTKNTQASLKSGVFYYLIEFSTPVNCKKIEVELVLTDKFPVAA